MAIQMGRTGTPEEGSTELLKVAARLSGEDRARLDLVYEVSKRAGASSRMKPLLEQIINMTQQTLNASAASVLLFDPDNRELSFEVASGPVEKALRREKINAGSGIAGWVARHGKPMIVNNANENRKFDPVVDELTGFSTRSIVCVPLLTQRKVMGVIEVINRADGTDFKDRDLEAVVSVAGTAAMAIENTRLHQTVLDAYKSTINTLAAASKRVKEYSLRAGNACSLSTEDMETLEYASVLHDIGKITIDASILNKPATLTPQEWELVCKHPVTGANLLKEIPFLEKASDLVLYHHERCDGTGYPHGLKSDSIPVGARLIAVADAFDTMTTDRSYRQALTIDYAISELQGNAGGQFCPTAVEAFITGLPKHGGKYRLVI